MTSNTRQQDHFANEHSTEYGRIVNGIARFKGFNEGFGIGFYDDPAFNENGECMTGSQLEALENIFEGFAHESSKVERLFKTITAAWMLFTQVKANCFAHSYLYDSITFCFI